MKLKNRIIVGFHDGNIGTDSFICCYLFGISETQHRNAANSESAQEML